jgi:hypothetical protein
MKRWILLTFIAAGVAFAADSWSKVHELKSGTELRIYQQGVKQPLLATFEDTNDESLIVATKKEELAIAKDKIERIDFRPASKDRMTAQTRTTSGPDTLGPPTQNHPPGPSSSTSSSVNFGSKPDFVTIYRRTAAGQK